MKDKYIVLKNLQIVPNLSLKMINWDFCWGNSQYLAPKKKDLPLTKKTRQGVENTKSQIISTKD